MEHLYRLVHFLVLWDAFICPSFQTSEVRISLQQVEDWANKISDHFVDLTRELTAVDNISYNYSSYSFRIEKVGEDVINNMSRDISNLLKNKITAIKELVIKAEELFMNHTYDNNLDFDYLNNKKICSSQEYELKRNQSGEEFAKQFQYLNLTSSENFNNIPINIEQSTVHVPTNVFDKSKTILNGVYWSEGLDSKFVENLQKDNTLKWQYFCSSDGFLRVFPGLTWPRRNKKGEGDIDLFDCRMRSWYLQAATCPKNVVILVDASGSMKGLRMEIARSTVHEIIDTLSDDDHFNIILFSNTSRYVDDCFNGTMLPANNPNKLRLKKLIKEIDTGSIANFELALEEAFHLLRSERLHRNGGLPLCNKAIALITDWVPRNYEWVFEENNWPNKTVRVFTYLIGREVPDNREIKWMACANKEDYHVIINLHGVFMGQLQQYGDSGERINMASQGYDNNTLFIEGDSFSQGLFSLEALLRKKYDNLHHTEADNRYMVGTVYPVYTVSKNYIKVLSRPMVINRYPNLIWTSVYLDQLSTFEMKKGLGFMTSVALPVFDRRNSSYLQGNLLGVVGADVPIDEIKKLIQPYKLGPNGYAFLVNHNGLVLFHPDYRPLYYPADEEESKDSGKLNPNYNNVDLSDVELAAEPVQLLRMREHLLSHNLGSDSMVIFKHYEQMKRMSRRKFDVFYNKIANTDFSLGISLPSEYGRHIIQSVKKIIDKNWFKGNDIRLAPWSYCKSLASHLKDRERIDALLKIQEDQEFAKKDCDEDLMQALKDDGLMTNGIIRTWEDKASRFKDKYGVELVFLGTRGGLTRFYKLLESNLSFIDENLNTVKALYYRKTVEGYYTGNGSKDGGFKVTVSIPLGQSITKDTLVTMTTPIVVEKNNLKAIAGVTGIILKYSHFVGHYMNVTNQCDVPNCTAVCSDETVSCFIIDNHGYILASSSTMGDAGKFLGEVQDDLMADLIDKGYFENATFVDYQAVCEIYACDEMKDSSASFLINPLKIFFNGILWIVTEIALFLTNWNCLAWWYGSQHITGARTSVRVESLLDYEDQNLTPMERQALIERNKDKQSMCYRSTAVVGYRSCHQNFTLYQANMTKFKGGYKTLNTQIRGCIHCTKYQKCENEDSECIPVCVRNDKYPIISEQSHTCNRSYVATWIKDTNMMLLVAANNCECESRIKFNLNAAEIKYSAAEECTRLRNFTYRDMSSTCHDYSRKEDEKTCGQCGLHISGALFFLSILFSLLHL